MKYTKKILKNGLRLVTVPLKDNPTVTAMVLVEAGSNYEKKEQNGLSHFLEHMCFKGTEKRPRSIDISSELDGIGATYNAFTSNEFTGYYAKASKRHTDTVLDVVSDIYLNPIFREDELDRERGVIIEEINMYEDLPQRTVHDEFGALLYGDTSAGRPILGPKENIRSFRVEDFYAYRDKHYVAEATTVVVAGDIDEKVIAKKVEKLFEDMRTGKKGKKDKVKDAQKSPAIRVRFKKTDQAHLVLGVRGFGLSHKDRVVANVIGGILGAGMSSRLWHRLREEMGVCYYAKAGHDSYTDHGSFIAFAGVDTKRVEEVIQVILEEFKKLTVEEVGDKELKKVKESLNGGMMMGLEASDDVADFFGFQELLQNEIKKPKEVAEKVRGVTAKDIKRVAKKLMVDKNLNLAIVGPYKDGKKFEKVLKF